MCLVLVIHEQTCLFFFHPDVFVLTECDILILLSQLLSVWVLFCFLLWTDLHYILHYITQENY